MNFKKKKLSNGLTIITVPIPEGLTTTILVLTETGSKYETKNINGISHFLEHLCFKGTKKRSVPQEVSEELDALGASYNAFTGHEYTGYYAKTEPKHFLKALDVVSDIYLNPTFPEKEIEKERGVIIGEIEMYEDNPQRKVGDLFTDVLYGDQPAGWDIAGTRETIRHIKRSQIVSYHGKHYVASATTVIAAGKFNYQEAVSSIQKAFAGISESKKCGKKKVNERQRNPRLKIEKRKTSQTHLILGVRSFGASSKWNDALPVLAVILGGGMSSRLFKKIREEMGAGYYIFAENEPFTDHGYFGISTGVANARTSEAVLAILEEVKKIKDEKVSGKELRKVKNQIIGTMFSSLETSSALAMYYGAMAALGIQLKTPEERAAGIRSVSSDDVQNVARHIFQNNRLNMALIGPAKDTRLIQKSLQM